VPTKKFFGIGLSGPTGVTYQVDGRNSNGTFKCIYANQHNLSSWFSIKTIFLRYEILSKAIGVGMLVAKISNPYKIG